MWTSPDPPAGLIFTNESTVVPSHTSIRLPRTESSMSASSDTRAVGEILITPAHATEGICFRRGAPGRGVGPQASGGQLGSARSLADITVGAVGHWTPTV